MLGIQTEVPSASNLLNLQALLHLVIVIVGVSYLMIVWDW